MSCRRGAPGHSGGCARLEAPERVPAGPCCTRTDTKKGKKKGMTGRLVLALLNQAVYIIKCFRRVLRLGPKKFRKTIMSAAVIRPSAAPSSGVRVVSCPFSASPRRSGSAEAPPDKVTPATFPVARQSPFAETSRSPFCTFSLESAKPSGAHSRLRLESALRKPSLYS